LADFPWASVPPSVAGDSVPLRQKKSGLGWASLKGVGSERAELFLATGFVRCPMLSLIDLNSGGLGRFLGRGLGLIETVILNQKEGEAAHGQD
jgi:hypothetical protein